MDKEKYVEVISKYLPDNCAVPIVDFIIEHNVSLKISKPRQTKLGDYRAPYKDKGHRISINNNLNKYAFLITLIHEFGHLITWNQKKNRVAPHGIEWKQNYSVLLRPYLDGAIFPVDVKNALENYIVNPAASSCTDLNLMKVLQSYNKTIDLVLEELHEGSEFILENGRPFKKGPKMRKYYKCTSLTNKREYRVHGMAKVIKME